jgi:6,7-dimethyl-8-ribityllumazine synthase
MFGAQKGNASHTDGSQLRIGIVQARFNEDITNALFAACQIGRASCRERV